MTFYFSFDNILSIVFIALGAAAIAIFWLLTVYRNKLSVVSRRAAADGEKLTDESQNGAPAAMPGLSLIVYVRDNARDLEEMLPLVLNQDYPGPTEVIVVNDGSSEDVKDVVKLQSANNDNLYQTFVPEEAHNLSRKKLAISLGIKAARYHYIVVTSAVSRPNSNKWLRAIGRHFAAGKDVVLGWADIDGLAGEMTRFDEAATAVTWLSEAITGKPYRGCGYNIAYSRKVFFDNKGFSSSLNLHNGEDDIFINDVATHRNTAVELSPESRVTVYPFRPKASFKERRLNHCFTGRNLPHGSRRIMGFSTIMMWVWLAATITGVVFSLPNVFPSIIFALFIPVLWVPLCISWRNTSRALDIPLHSSVVWWNMMWRWTVTIPYKLRCGSSKRQNYTWRQK